MTTLTKPTKQTIAYKAAMLVYEEGPMSRIDLFTRIDFGATGSSREKAFRVGISDGWLEFNQSGDVDITQKALIHFEQHERRKNEPPTSVATSRQWNVYERPVYVPPKRIIRQDAPPLYPAGFHFRTIEG